MSVTTNTGEQQFWYFGLPFVGLNKFSLNTGEQQFWYFGLPTGFIFFSNRSNFFIMFQ